MTRLDLSVFVFIIMEPNTNNQQFPRELVWRNLNGFIQTVTEEPSYTPKGVFEQFVIATTGGSSRAYIFNTSSRTWLSVALA